MSRTNVLLANLATIGILAFSATGCGVEEMQKMKVQADLGEAARQASIGQIPTAKRWIGRAIQADPDDIDTYLNANNDPDVITVDGLFRAAGDLRDVVYYDQQAAAKFPNEYRILALLMDAQDMVGDTAGRAQTAQKLIGVLEARVAKRNVDAQVLSTLGGAYWVVGNRQKAMSTYQSAMSTYMTDWSVYNNMAYEIADANSKPDLPQALNAAKTALAKAQMQGADDSELAVIQDTVGWVEYRQGNYKQAEVDMNQALETIPRKPESLYHLGMIYLAEGDRAAARSKLESVLAITPDYANAKIALAQAETSDNDGPVAAPRIRTTALAQTGTR